jgi:hypothetical protein
MSAEPLQSVPEVPEEPQKGEKVERGRSRIEWPYFSLDEAVKLAKGIFDLGGNCQIDQLAGHLKQTATGGAFRLKVQASRTFGLVNSIQGQLTLTDLGAEIVDPDGDREAKATSFMRVPLYSAIYEQFKGKTLPGLVGLENAMVNLGVAVKQKDKARQAFLRSAKEAGFFNYGATKLVPPVFTQDRNSKEPKSVEQVSIPAPTNGSKAATGGSNGGGGGNGGGNGLDPLVQGFLNKLPDPTVPWPLDGRRKWLQMVLGILDVMYTGAEEGKSLTITVESDSVK